MKFLIHIDPTYQEELDGLANGLSLNNHEVIGFQNSIFRAKEDQAPDYFILTSNSMKSNDIISFLMKHRPKHMIVDRGIIQLFDGKMINLPSFANTIKYRPALPSKELESDVLIYFDGNSPDMVHGWYSRLFRQYKVKMCGQFINCPGFVGLCSPDEITKLAKSAKVTLSTNKIVADSLLYNGIPAYLDIVDFSDIEKLELDVIQKRRDIITERKLGNIICERLSNPN